MDPFIRRGSAKVFVDDEPVGEGVSFSYSEHMADGTLVAPAGTCPQCRTVSLDGQIIICMHGVTLPVLPGLPGGPRL